MQRAGSLLKITEIIYNDLAEASKPALIDFVIYVKLSQTVKTNVTAIQTPTTFEELKTTLQRKYKSTATIPHIQNQLANLSQRNLSISNYKNKILQLVSELNALQIGQLGASASNEQKL